MAQLIVLQMNIDIGIPLLLLKSIMNMWIFYNKFIKLILKIKH